MVTESQFYMWRAVFAMAHVDGRIRQPERDLMLEILNEFDFSTHQRAVLEADMDAPQDPMDMYRLIPSYEDKTKFFEFATQMVKVDGEFHVTEREVLSRIQRRHIYGVDVKSMVGHVELEIEGEEKKNNDPKHAQEKPKKIMYTQPEDEKSGFLNAFKDVFRKKDP